MSRLDWILIIAPPSQIEGFTVTKYKTKALRYARILQMAQYHYIIIFLFCVDSRNSSFGSA